MEGPRFKRQGVGCLALGTSFCHGSFLQERIQLFQNRLQIGIQFIKEARCVAEVAGAGLALQKAGGRAAISGDAVAVIALFRRIRDPVPATPQRTIRAAERIGQICIARREIAGLTGVNLSIAAAEEQVAAIGPAGNDRRSASTVALNETLF